MSIVIQRISDRPDGVIATTVCDLCNYVMATRPAQPGEHAGTTLMVHHTCVECVKKRQPLFVYPGASVVNQAAVARVTLQD